jgi:hypothetical protein
MGSIPRGEPRGEATVSVDAPLQAVTESASFDGPIWREPVKTVRRLATRADQERCMHESHNRLRAILRRQIRILLPDNAKLAYPALEHILIRQALHAIQLPPDPLDDRAQLHGKRQLGHRGRARRRRRLRDEVAPPRGEQVAPDPAGEFGVAAVALELTALRGREARLSARDRVVKRDPGALPLLAHLLHVLAHDALVLLFAERQPHLVLGEFEEVGEDLGLVGLGDGRGGREGG